MSPISRRGFLGGLLGAIAIAAVPAALATPSGQPAQPNKYQKALDLYQSMSDSKHDVVVLNQKADVLLTYLMDTFPFEQNDNTQAQMTAMLRGQHDPSGWTKIPPSVSDAIYPVALARMALAVDQLQWNPQRLQSFDRFHKVYGHAIVNS